MQSFNIDRFPRLLKALMNAVLPVSVQGRLIHKDESRPASVWDDEFGSGAWRYLEGAAEMPRYAVIAGYLRADTARRTILDVGCGAGALQPWLSSVGYKHYRGVDLPATAINEAQQRANETTSFEAADAATYKPDGAFDIIIFNEMLYYLTNPVGTIHHYSKSLTPGGKFIISLYHSRESWQVWRKCRASLTLLDETRIDHAGMSWRVRLCQPEA